MNLALFIARRYSLASQGNGFISFIATISIIGISLGVAVLIIVLSVMNGFEKELQQRILGAIPHASLHAQPPLDNWRQVIQQVQQQPEVVAAAPFINIEGMLVGGDRVQGVVVTGIDSAYENKVSIIDQHMVVGSLDDLQAGSFNLVIGEILAQKLQLAIGDKVNFILPQVSISPVGIMPRIKRLTVSGIFSLGAQLDARLAFINLADAGRLLHLGDAVQGIRLEFVDLFQAPQLVRQIAPSIKGISATSDWTYSQGNLFQSIAMERRMVSLLLFLIIAVAAFNIVSNLIMMVADKRSDIAILRTLGASKAKIMAIFVAHGSMVGVFGSLIGVVLGVGISLSIEKIALFIENIFGIQFFSADTYFISYLPADLRWENVVFVTGVSLAISLLVTIYPAYKAMQINPAAELKND
jgi:lipoprotein-releasing system permease protein